MGPNYMALRDIRAKWGMHFNPPSIIFGPHSQSGLATVLVRSFARWRGISERGARGSAHSLREQRPAMD
eukprot:2731754-Pyramimonas_sp.AAC.1